MLDVFGPATRLWFEAEFETPTEVQLKGWPRIVAGDSCLLVAPTGSGKTLAAFLAGIDRLSQREPGGEFGVRVLYVSPLKALVYDVERNLRAPLEGVREAALRGGFDWTDVRVDVRTGDTPQKDRVRQARAPGEILVTTPESLYLLLSSRARATLRTVETVIIDEIHSLAPGKRGSHLALSLERLSEITARDPQRIGLSATVRPMVEIARFLGGDRHVEVIDTSEPPRLDLAIRVPVPDMQNVRVPISQEAQGDQERGIWPALYPQLLAEIREHRSTILFVNSRGLCEKLAQRLNNLAGEELVLAHHGSVSHERRTEIENGLKAGEVRGIVATSSLELGIDMGAVDRVILVESPGSVARGLQRVGRAGHQVGAASGGTVYPKYRGDLLECAVIAERMAQGSIESVRIPRNALDVLAQQIVAMVCDRARTPDEIATLVRRSYPYRELSPAALEAVLDMLTGRFPGTELADLRPRLRWDRSANVLSARRGAEMIVRFNAGTIPDRGTYGVYIGAGGPRIGDLDEEMVYESRPGDTFVLGASTWRVEEVTRDRVIVSPAPGQPGRMPFWKGPGPGRPFELGRAIGAFVRELGAELDADPTNWLKQRVPVDDFAASNLIEHIRDQRDASERLPTDRTIVVERFRDELGDWRVCILSHFGTAIHAPWAMALGRLVQSRTGVDVEALYTDDGIVLSFADSDQVPATNQLFPAPEDITELITEQLGHTALFSSLFRENAVRSLLVPRRRPQQRNPLWAQRLKTRALLSTVQHHPDFPILLETYREALSDVFDVPGLRSLLEEVRAGTVEVHSAETTAPSPFARSLVFAYVANYLYNADAPVAERRAQALTLDRALLSELVGQAQLRELLDADVLQAVEAELQGEADGRHARDRDELHDLLRRVGDLDAREMGTRCEGDADAWLKELVAERRVLGIHIAGDSRWIASDDAELYGDPRAALDQLVPRYARTHGPFTTLEVAARFGVRSSDVEPILTALVGSRDLHHGALRPSGHELEWCDSGVLRKLKRRTLELLRKEVAAVDGPTLARFLPAWHGIGKDDRSPQRLREVIEQLQGTALPWRVLQGEVLPARIPGFHIDALDAMAARGELVWIGAGALGSRDGRIGLFTREDVHRLHEPDLSFEPKDERQRAVLAHLEARGASFLTQIERSVRERLGSLSQADLESTLWELVWAGLLTNDTFQPLRSLADAGRSKRRGRRGGRDLLAGGRWSLVSDLSDPDLPPTERLHARAEVLLRRYGIVAREAAQAEDLPGGYTALSRILQAMEEVGRLRRGHFVDGWSGAQYALPGAVDRLRAMRPSSALPSALVLSALDPASPWGTLADWPETTGGDAHRPRRIAGARVISVDGQACLWAGASGRHLVTFAQRTEAELRSAFAALAIAPFAKRLVIEQIDGVSVFASPLRELILTAGYVSDYRALTPE